MVIIEDNGVGLEIEAGSEQNRLSLSGMRESLELVGATLEVESRSGSGATIYVVLPLEAN